MKAKARVSARLPLDCYKTLEHVAASGGYASVSALTRCILVQFVKCRERHQLDSNEPDPEWVEHMFNDCAAAGLTPANRDAINRRL